MCRSPIDEVGPAVVRAGPRSLSLCVATAAAAPFLLAAAALAQQPARISGPPAHRLTFPVDPIAFGPPSPLAFNTTALTFPLALQQRLIGDQTEVELPADVLFDFAKDTVRADASETLHELALLLRQRARSSISVTGHTDGLGSDRYNQALSERRAVAVREWLVRREGIMSPIIRPSGRGARAPVAPNRHPDGSDNPEGRQLNRRVTIVFR